MLAQNPENRRRRLARPTLPQRSTSQHSTDTLRLVPCCLHNMYSTHSSTPMKALKLAIFFVAAGLASASISNMILSEDNADMSTNGTLRYATLPFPEKMSLFKRYQIDNDRKVTNHRGKRFSNPPPLTLHALSDTHTVHIRCGGEGETSHFRGVAAENRRA